MLRTTVIFLWSMWMCMCINIIIDCVWISDSHIRCSASSFSLHSGCNVFALFSFLDESRFENNSTIPSKFLGGSCELTGVCWPASFSSVLISLDWFYFAHNLTGDILKYRYSFCSVFLSRDVNYLELHFWVRMCLAGFQTMCHTWLFRTSVKSQITLWDTARPFSIYFMWLCLWEIV